MVRIKEIVPGLGVDANFHNCLHHALPSESLSLHIRNIIANKGLQKTTGTLCSNGSYGQAA